MGGRIRLEPVAECSLEWAAEWTGIRTYTNAKVTYDRADGVLSSYVSGNTYEYALGKGVSGATGEIADYARDRAEGAFDVIYVPPGIHVQIFVEAQIAIDYHTDGRKLGYDYARGVSYEHLD